MVVIIAETSYCIASKKKIRFVLPLLSIHTNAMAIGQNGNRRRTRSSRNSKSKDPSDGSSEMSYIELQNTSWRWWNQHLLNAGWIRFKADSKYCFADGFIPVQYVTKESGDNVRTIKKYVMTHGERGVHYVLGWHELYDLVKKFGILTTPDLDKAYKSAQSTTCTVSSVANALSALSTFGNIS